LEQQFGSPGESIPVHLLDAANLNVLISFHKFCEQEMTTICRGTYGPYNSIKLQDVRKKISGVHDMDCTRCESGGRLSRTKRKGFLEEKLYSLLGYYPWICSSCKQRVLVKKRGQRKSRGDSGRDFDSSTYSLKRDPDSPLDF
jgi:hypothetical protein